MRLGILASHPIQYHAPWFRALAREIDLDVYFAHEQSPKGQAAAGFDVAFEWDVDLLQGYRSRYLRNVAQEPDVNRYSGCDTPEIAQIIRDDNFDAFIVIGWYLKSHWQAIRACRKAGVPVLARGDSQLLTPRSRLKTWAKRLTHSIMLKQFDGFLAAGQRSRDYLRHYGVRDERIYFVPQSVDTEWFAQRAAALADDAEKKRAEWGASPDAVVVLFVGKFIPEKRPQDVLTAVAKCETKVVAIFVGSGPLESELRTLAADTELSVRFEGFKNQSELPLYYVSADVLVLPSVSETWGLVVDEAFACGTPAIVSREVGCAPDLIDEGKTGFTFPTGDTDTLAQKLSAFAREKEAGRDWGLCVSAKAAQYSAEAAAAATVTALNRVIG